MTTRMELGHKLGKGSYYLFINNHLRSSWPATNECTGNVNFAGYGPFFANPVTCNAHIPQACSPVQRGSRDSTWHDLVVIYMYVCIQTTTLPQTLGKAPP